MTSRPAAEPRGADPQGSDGGAFASIDVGATSVHLLVSAVRGHHLEPLLDTSSLLRLGDRIQGTGSLGSAAREELVTTLTQYATEARQAGAGTVTIVGTEPMRRAADAGRIVHEVERASGAPLHVLGHEEEGVLTLLGVTGGARVRRAVVVVDIGGGSTEFVTVGRDRPPLVTGIPAGAATITTQVVAHDPPTPAEVGAMLERARLLLARAPDAAPDDLVAVGGTASNLLKVVTGHPIDPSLSLDEVRTALEGFTEVPATELTARYLVNPVRARILPAGAAIVIALLERYRVDRLRVSHAGIREGTILAVARGGPCWRDRLSTLARGWRDG